jgi:hypothetical protein
MFTGVVVAIGQPAVLAPLAGQLQATGGRSKRVDDRAIGFNTMILPAGPAGGRRRSSQVYRWRPRSRPFAARGGEY